MTLRYPNREVEQGLLEFLLPHYSRCPDNPRTFVADLADMLRDNRVDDFLIALRTLIPDIAYELVTSESRERHYHSLFYIICRLIGFDAHCEYVTINGRIDMLVKTRTHIYIFEFKLDQSADIAIGQINRVGYTIPFERDGRKIVRVGVNFSSTTRTIEDWTISEED